MFCKNCGQQIPAGVVFCPNCGEQVQTPIELINSGNDTTEKRKKPIGAIIFALIFIAVVVVGVIFVIKALSQPKYSEDNQFATVAKDVEKDSEQYHLLNAFASVQNLLFNSESFEFEFKIGSDNVEGKIVFGEDISSTKIVLDIDAYMDAVLSDGLLQACAFDESIEINIGEVLKGTSELKDVIIENLEGIRGETSNMLKHLKEGGADDATIERYESRVEAYDLVLEKLEESFPEIEKALQAIVYDNHLNYDSFAIIFDEYFTTYFDASMEVFMGRGGSDDEFFNELTMPTFDFIWQTMADFLANGITDDDIQVDVEKEGKGKEAITKYNIKFDVADLLLAFYEYASENKDILAIFGDKADDLLDEIEDNIDYIEDYSQKIKFSIEAQNGYVTKFEMKIDGEKINLEFRNVNNTEITEEEIKDIQSDVEDADLVGSIDDVDDIIDMITR